MNKRIEQVLQRVANIEDECDTIRYELLIESKAEIIRVPGCIKIEINGGADGDNLGIVFNNNKQVLSYRNKNEGIYDIDCASKTLFIQTQLIKIDPSEKVEGGTYYFTDNYDPQTTIDNLFNYCKYINGVFISIHNGYPTNVVIGFDHWYKVVPLEDER